MRKIELLAPAGDKESLIAAIQNGANAIYLGGTLFNARAFAKNFDQEDLLWAIEYAHLRNVRIFVTVNTLYEDEEFIGLVDYLDFLYDIQVDALIVQDIGLLDLIHKRYPDFEIHISTQASVMNKEAVQYFKNMGASRVVLARENTIEEIKEICLSTDLDIEVFVHGAMCVCYSGQCLMSSVIGNRSGNRGQCAQPCRLKYKLMKDGEILQDKFPFLLSPKDLMTLEHIDALIEAGVYSFKIEGRMKRPEYVGSVVKAYRHAIDQYYQKKKISFEEDIYDMKSMFNRDYTSGYIFHDDHIVYGDYSGNKGIIVGKVIGYKKKEKIVTILLSDSIKQGDSLVFENIDKGRPINKIYLKNKLVSQALPNDKVDIEFDYPVYEGIVRKTVNVDVIDKIKKTYNKENVKKPIFMKFSGKIGEPALLEVNYLHHQIKVFSHILFEKAQTHPLDHSRIKQQLSKLGQTVFYAKEIMIDTDRQSTIPIKVINELRREAIEKLNQMIIKEPIHTHHSNYFPTLQKQITKKHEIHVLVSHIEQLKSLFDYSIDYIYYPYQKDALEAYHLCQEQNKDMILFIPRICKDENIREIIHSQVYQKVKHVLVNDFGSYYVMKNKERILGTGINIYNSYSSHLISHKHILSLEIDYQKLSSMNIDFSNAIYQIYGKIENMISEYCPISQYYFGYQKKNCHICRNHQFSLLDRKNICFDLLMDEQCRMHLLNNQARWIRNIKKIPTQGLFLHFTNENQKEIHEILEKLKKEGYNY